MDESKVYDLRNEMEKLNNELKELTSERSTMYHKFREIVIFDSYHVSSPLEVIDREIELYNNKLKELSKEYKEVIKQIGIEPSNRLEQQIEDLNTILLGVGNIELKLKYKNTNGKSDFQREMNIIKYLKSKNE